MKNRLILAMALAITSLPAMAQAPAPPRTAAGRAVDSAVQDLSDANRRIGDPLNIEGKPDGTPGNPPGTAVGRAFDRAAGTNTSGAYPAEPSGTPINPSGTLVNPPDTAPSKTVR